MLDELVGFWRKCELISAPFVHPEDNDILRKDNGRFFIKEPLNFNTFVASQSFGKSDNHRFHLSLRPVPYLGNLREAKIVILLLNPGLSYTDYWAETNALAFQKKFQKRLEDNLRQSFDDVDYPFFGLDPEFCWWGGFVWWEKKLHDVIQLLAETKFGKSYVAAMRDLSIKLACLELVPYHSSSFGAHALMNNAAQADNLPSVKIIRKFVKNSLIPMANKGERTVIVTRQAENWGFAKNTKDTKNLFIYRGGQTRGASLSPKSSGGKAILRHYGIG